MSEKIAQTWAIEKTREELKNELLQLLILLPDNDLKGVYDLMRIKYFFILKDI